MSEKRFNRVGGYVYDGDKCISHFEDVAHRDDIVKLLNELHDKYIDEYALRETLQLELQRVEEENEQLKTQLSKYDKPKISIFNKDKGDWKWNDNNDIILNIRNGKSFYLRNSGAVENLVDLLNELHEENEQLQHDATILIQSNQDYRKKNEELKQQLMDCEKFRHTVFQEISKEMNKHD